jgi:hypothetical protein
MSGEVAVSEAEKWNSAVMTKFKTAYYLEILQRVLRKIARDLSQDIWAS